MFRFIKPLIITTSIALTPTAALADDLLPTIEGVWKGEMRVGGMMGTMDVELTATEIGGMLSFKRHFVSCKYAFAPKEEATPTVYERFLISETGGTCSRGDMRLSVSNGTALSLKLLGTRFPDTALRKVNGSAARSADASGIEILGFTLNDKLVDLAKITGAPVSVVGTPRTQTRGMRGDLSRYAQADMTQAEWRLSSSGKLQDVAYDIVGAYRLGNTDTASALARVWIPEPQDAPTFDATIKALRDTLGAETEYSKSGTVRASLTWHFAPTGQRVSKSSSHACNVVNRGTDSVLVLRYIGSDVRLVPGNDVMVMGAPASVRRVAKKKSQNFQVKPRLGCGVSVTYTITRRKNGGLKELSAMAFDHAAFINGGWDQQKKQIIRDVQRIVTTAKTQRGNAPRL